MSKEIVTTKVKYEYQEEFKGEIVMRIIYQGKKYIARYGKRLKKEDRDVTN